MEELCEKFACTTKHEVVFQPRLSQRLGKTAPDDLKNGALVSEGKRCHHSLSSMEIAVCNSCSQHSVSCDLKDALGLTFPFLDRILRGFWARGRVRGDRSVFVTSHRPVHLSRALLFSAWFELLHFRTGAIFLFDGFACLLMNTLIIKVLLLEFEQVFLCELHTPPSLFSRVQRTAFTAKTASVETVSK